MAMKKCYNLSETVLPEEIISERLQWILFVLLGNIIEILSDFSISL